MSQRPFFVPEVVQTSAMDCGPATLKCLLSGYGIDVSYGRLREACQTDVDGTSIDTLEDIANQLGLAAEQQVLPADHLLDKEGESLPAIVVVRQPSGFLHFVVVWQILGPYVQVMNPLAGRQWMRREVFTEELYLHSCEVEADGWRAWAGQEDFQQVLLRRLRAVGVKNEKAEGLLKDALASEDWKPMAALDSALRLAASLLHSKALRKGEESLQFLRASLERVREQGQQVIPNRYWSVVPHPETTHEVILRGAIILSGGDGLLENAGPVSELPPELRAAMEERSQSPLAALGEAVAQDGWQVPRYLLGILALSALGLMIEALLFRGLFEIWADLSLVPQRAAVLGAVTVFLVMMLSLESLGQGALLKVGRRLEARLRMSFLKKLSRLSDRYFHSRPISEVSGRGHSIQLIRELPPLIGAMFRAGFELVLTALGLIWLFPEGALWTALAALLSLSLPFVMQPFLVERELRARSHGEALSRYYLDGLLGLQVARSHSAEAAIRSEHQSILTEWMRSAYRLHRMVVTGEALHLLVSVLVAAGLFFAYISGAETGSGGLLLYVYWALNLPFLGQELAVQARLYPSRRNATERIMELLLAKGEQDLASEGGGDCLIEGKGPGELGAIPSAAKLSFEQVGVLVAGHRVLQGLSAEILPGEHVAIVGPSGAGKSSLVGLLLGWHRAFKGQVLVDGVPLRGEGLQRLRRDTIWVDPAVHIWNQALVDNLFYASGEARPEALSDTLQKGELEGVIERLPTGLQSQLGEGGGLLSGGEGQRVRFSRGLLQQSPRLVILDEPFRGLDRGQRALLLKRAREKWQNITFICVTHDVGETQGFPRVMVIEDGQLVEDGKPSVLKAKKDSRYAGLLQAEKVLRRDLWSGPQWRQVRLDGGTLAAEGDSQ